MVRFTVNQTFYFSIFRSRSILTFYIKLNIKTNFYHKREWVRKNFFLLLLLFLSPDPHSQLLWKIIVLSWIKFQKCSPHLLRLFSLFTFTENLLNKMKNNRVFCFNWISKVSYFEIYKGKSTSCMTFMRARQGFVQVHQLLDPISYFCYQILQLIVE